MWWGLSGRGIKVFIDKIGTTPLKRNILIINIKRILYILLCYFQYKWPFSQGLFWYVFRYYKRGILKYVRKN